MAERNSKLDPLPKSLERFILRWGDLGSSWGVNRSVAQIHALLFVSTEPITAEEIAERLGIARSNVSTSLKELLSWRLIERVPVLGDRRDHFTAETDPWEMASRIAETRRDREIDPAALALEACLAEAEQRGDANPEVLKRLDDLHAFVEMGSKWHRQMQKVPFPKLSKLVKMGTKLVDLLPAGRKAKPKKG